MTVYSDDRQFVQRNISVPALIAQQRTALANTLMEIIRTLDEAEMKHREQFKDEKLADCFPPTLGYYFGKIFEALHSSRYFPFGKMHVDLVAECLDKMRAFLEKRGDWGIYDSVNYEYELLEYPLAELKAYFTDPAQSKFNEKGIFIFCAFVKEQLKTLQQIAAEFDEQYASLPGGDD